MIWRFRVFMGIVWATLVTALGLLIFFLNGHIDIWFFNLFWEVALPGLSLIIFGVKKLSGATLVAALITGWLFWICIFTLFPRRRPKS
jgi:hypothetical protein